MAVTRSGRPRITSRAELERAALRLFLDRGFDETSVDDIAAAAGIGRRTFFRYYQSKNDVVWGDFDAALAALTEWFVQCPRSVQLADAVRDGVIWFNSYPSAQLPAHRSRMQLILTTPALQAHSTLRYREWRDVVATFAADRLGVDPYELLPQVVGRTALAAAVSAYEHWLRSDDDLAALLRTSLSIAAQGWGDLSARWEPSR